MIDQYDFQDKQDLLNLFKVYALGTRVPTWDTPFAAWRSQETIASVSAQPRQKEYIFEARLAHVFSCPDKYYTGTLTRVKNAVSRRIYAEPLNIVERALLSAMGGDRELTIELLKAAVVQMEGIIR
jgi:hypothetical protein